MPLAGLNTLLDDIGTDLPPWLSVSTSDPTVPQEHHLYPIERAAIMRAIVKRRNEFAAGRQAARAAMARVPWPEQPIPMSEDRSPVWPEGLIGSISHYETACIAAVAQSRHLAAIGIDIEPYEPLDEDILPSICSIRELERLPDAPALSGRRIFCAKEAAYKAQFALSRTLFGFETLSVCHAEDTTLTVRFCRNVAPFRVGEHLAIRQWCGYGVILSLALISL